MYAIRDIRKSQNLSQEDLARMLGTTQATISRIENAEQQLTLHTASKIAAALGCKLDDLIKED